MTDNKEEVLVSTDKYLPTPSHVEYYSTLKGAAYVEPTAAKSNLLI